MGRTARIVRWVARILAVVSVGLVLALVVAESPGPLNRGARDAVLFVFFPLGVCVGMLLGWWRELWGGVVAVASLALFYGIHFVASGRFPGGPYFLIFTVPGILFLLAWAMRPRPKEKDAATL